MLISLWINWCVLVWSEASGSRRSGIALRDRDFVGEDPVLAAELARRMEQTRPSLKELNSNELSPRMRIEPSLESKRPFTRGGRPLESGPSGAGHLGLTDPGPGNVGPGNVSPGNLSSSNNTRRFFNYFYDPYWDLSAKRTKYVPGPGDEHKFIEYKKDWNSTNLYAMHLKVAEQAIYGVQMRLLDLERVLNKYKNHPLLRMAYILKRLDIWHIEMHDFYMYSHMNHDIFQAGSWKYMLYIPPKPNTNDNPWWMANIRHIMYYQAILRRYIDVVYSVKYLREQHAIQQGRNKVGRKSKKSSNDTKDSEDSNDNTDKKKNK